MVLDKVNTPDDVKKLSIDEMKSLANEIRELIIKKVNTTGGHLGPNLGIVEATIAYHYVFNSPVDKIVFDVSHQCYPHKILTGRKEGFLNPDKYLTYTGYTAPEESKHDIFKVGHTSTSVSLAVGLAHARDLKGESANITALIGDGSLTGGEALEGLNNGACLNSNFIVIVNDNDMSIAENHGGLYSNLKLLKDTKGTAENNFFKAMGYDYLYVEDGNDVEKLIEAFKKVKNISHPIVVHIHTLKGKGLKYAEENKEMCHWIIPHALDEGQPVFEQTEDYNSITKEFIIKKASKDETIVAITPATPGVHGFDSAFRDSLKKQYTDVGIAEEHAVAYSSGLAKNGAKPILNIMSSFVQRAYDQISQDICLNNSPVTMLVYWGGLSGADCTHLGCFDIPFLSNIPNLVYLAPTNKEEYLKMLDWSVEQTEYPVAIRIPNINVVSNNIPDTTDYSILNKFKVAEKGNGIALLGLGNFFYKAKELKEIIKDRLNINATLINPVYMTGIDEKLLSELESNHNLVVTLEDGILDGGFGEKISRFYSRSNMKVLNCGAKKEFTDRVSLDEIYRNNRLTNDLILEDIEKILKEPACI